MSELIIHIGAHKTGTTSIQYACRNFLGRPADSGVAYLVHEGTNGPGLVGTEGRLGTFRGTVRQKRMETVLQPRADRNILSSELLFFVHDAAEVARLAEVAQARFDRIRVMAYLRRQDLLALSHRKQVVFGSLAAQFYGVQATPLPVYQPHFQRYFDYAAKLADLWGGAFGIGNVEPVLYERNALTDGDVVLDFARRAGIRWQGYDGAPRNASMNGDRLLAGLKLLEHDMPRSLRKHIFQHLKSGEAQFLPSRAEAEAFLARFAESNARLATLFTSDGRPFRFDDSMDMYPETSGEIWDNSRAEKLLEAVLSGLRDGGYLPPRDTGDED